MEYRKQWDIVSEGIIFPSHYQQWSCGRKMAMADVPHICNRKPSNQVWLFQCNCKWARLIKTNPLGFFLCQYYPSSWIDGSVSISDVIDRRVEEIMERMASCSPGFQIDQIFTPFRTIMVWSNPGRYIILLSSDRQYLYLEILSFLFESSSF